MKGSSGMKLNFKLCEINEKSKLWDIVGKGNGLNEFIIVGEEVIKNNEHYKLLQLNDNGIKLIGGLLLDEAAYTIEKSDVMLKKDEYPGTLYTELDIPKEFLTVDIIETIERINE